MLDVKIFTDIATAALAVLVAVLACYLALRLLGKVAKFLVTVIVIVLVVWFVFSDHSILSGYINLALPSLPII